MEKFIINGGKKIKGEIKVSGAKNAALKFFQRQFYRERDNQGFNGLRPWRQDTRDPILRHELVRVSNRFVGRNRDGVEDHPAF